MYFSFIFMLLVKVVKLCIILANIGVALATPQFARVAHF